MTELEQQLADAKARFAAASKAMMAKHRGGEWDEYNAAHAALLAAERASCAARNEEHAVPLDFPVRWDTGAPMPQLLVNEHEVFLIFLVREVDPSWDGTYATVKSATSDEVEPLALVTFKRCTAVKLGAPNDEVFHGHPLSGRGGEPYTAQRVVHSRWLGELQQINSVHGGYDPARWKTRTHHVLWFHDSTFECIAEGFEVELRRCSMGDMVREACRRLTGEPVQSVSP